MATADASFTFDLHAVSQAVRPRSELERLGREMRDDARRYVRVDTGELRDSIDFEVSGDDGDAELRLFATAPHWVHNEFGTESMPASPFLRPALARGGR